MILAKTWRVYYIFINHTPKKLVYPFFRMLSKHHGSLDSRLIKDWFLFIVVLVVVEVDLLIILTGTFIPSSHLNDTIFPDAQHNAINPNVSIVMHSNIYL